MSARRFHVANFGCRASQSDGAAIEDALLGEGAGRAASPMDADVVVINSCTVTGEADRDVDRLIRRMSRRRPGARIIVTGCYAERDPEGLAAMPGVRSVVGNSRKSRVPALALEALNDPAGAGRAEVFCSDVFESPAAAPAPGSAGRTRAVVKVQDGCDARCSFCIIPAVRGPGRSLDPAAVVERVAGLIEGGRREVVFSGIHLGAYCRDLRPRTPLAALIRRTLDALPGLERLRLSSIEPREMSAEIVELVAAEPRIAAHLHVPLQSGSARVLRRMRRPYGPADYRDLVRRIRAAVPDAAIGADVMVGFPGETDDEFLETFRLIEASPLTYLHVFPFSARPGTPAAAMPDPVPRHVARFRGHRLRRLIAEKNAAFRRSFVGRELDVLVLDDDARNGRRAGLTDNFIRARAPEGLAVNRWHAVRVTSLDEAGITVDTFDPGGRTA